MFHIAFKKQGIGDHTPFSLYERVRTENSCILHTGLGRYVFIGYQPFTLFRSKNRRNFVAKFLYTADSVDEDAQIFDGEPLPVLQGIFDSVKISHEQKLPKDFPPFLGGAIGYFGYDFGLQLYNIKSRVKDDLCTPDLYFAFYDKIIIFDYEKDLLYFIGFAENKKGAKKLVYEIEDDILNGLFYDDEFFAGSLSNKPKSNLTHVQYRKKIVRIKGCLARGETYQVNFSQRFKCSYDDDPFVLFKKLCDINESPYSCFIDDPDLCVISCSPERLFALHDCLIDVRPIKGTVLRGRSDAEDKKQIAKLLASKKDDAELSMIVDLYRNDIGKICRPGTVLVSEHRRIEKYSHVIHTLSVIRGVVQKDVNISDIVCAMFPGGSVTGCPKKRTMEIIDKLEQYARGIYCGSAGYISFGGDAEFNILIRTFAYKDGNLYFHGGGGITIDSDVDREYQETISKVQALMKSLI